SFGYFTFLPAIVVSPPLAAAAAALGLSFFGFLASLWPLFFSLDMGLPYRLRLRPAGAGRSVAPGGVRGACRLRQGDDPDGQRAACAGPARRNLSRPLQHARGIARGVSGN